MMYKLFVLSIGVTALSICGCANQRVDSSPVALTTIGEMNENRQTDAGQISVSTRSRSKPNPAREAVHKMLSDLRRRGGEAAERGEFSLAEDLFRQVCELNSRNPYEHYNLATLYDRMGRDREALEEYRIVVEGLPNTYSSLMDEPRVLLRYADLCLKYGEPEVAREMYARAAAKPSRNYGPLEPGIVPGKSFADLRAAAHFAVALRYRGHGEDEKARAELDKAIRLAPSWWLPHFQRAKVLIEIPNQRLESRLAFAEAERLAKGANKEVVVREAKSWGLHRRPEATTARDGAER